MNILKKILSILALCSLIVSCKTEAENNSTKTEIKSLEDIRGQRIAVLTGSLQEIDLSALGFGEDLVRLDNMPDIFASLMSGNAVYALMDSTAVIGASIEEKGIGCCFVTDPSGSYGYAFNKDDGQLCKSVNAFLAKIKQDGTHAAVTERYLSGEFLDTPVPEFEFAADSKPLKIGVSNLFPFAYMQDNEWAGYDMELLYMFCEGNGYHPVVVNTNFPALLPALVTKKIDVVASALTISEERAKNVLFSDPYMYCRSGCFTMTGKGPAKAGEGTGVHAVLGRIKKSFESNFLVEDRWKLILYGLKETVIISLFSILLGGLLGVFVCALKFSKSAIVRKTTDMICSFIGGIPILVLLMVMYYIVFVSTPLSARAVAIIAFAINFGCSISNVYYTGVTSVDSGQSEAGLALGFTYSRAFSLFVFPQAVKKIIPLFKGEAVSLLKNTSVVGYIAIQDLTKMSDIIRSRTFDAFFPLISIALIYLVLAWLLGKFMDILAKE